MLCQYPFHGSNKMSSNKTIKENMPSTTDCSLFSRNSTKIGGKGLQIIVWIKLIRNELEYYKHVNCHYTFLYGTFSYIFCLYSRVYTIFSCQSNQTYRSYSYFSTAPPGKEVGISQTLVDRLTPNLERMFSTCIFIDRTISFKIWFFSLFF